MKCSQPKTSIQRVCRVFGKSRQGYYDSLKRRDKEKVNVELICHHVLERRKILIKEGARKLHHNLKDVFAAEGIAIGRDRFIEVLRENKLLVRRRKRGKRTTNSDHPYKKYSNLIKDKTVTTPESVWVTDITYIPFKQGFTYLSLITDLYSKKIVGWELYPNLKTAGPLNALKRALRARRYPQRQLIHHSDRGVQYCSHEYTKILMNKKIEISMAETGNPYENAVAERVNGILKDEFFLDSIWCDKMEELKGVIGNSIWIYNNMRSHASCDYLTPEKAHQCSGAFRKRWYKKVL